MRNCLVSGEIPEPGSFKFPLAVQRRFLDMK